MGYCNLDDFGQSGACIHKEIAIANSNRPPPKKKMKKKTKEGKVLSCLFKFA